MRTLIVAIILRSRTRRADGSETVVPRVNEKFASIILSSTFIHITLRYRITVTDLQNVKSVENTLQRARKFKDFHSS